MPAAIRKAVFLILHVGRPTERHQLESNRIMLVNGLSALMLTITSGFLIFFILYGFSHWYHVLFAYPVYAFALRANFKRQHSRSRNIFFWGTLALLIFWSMLNRRIGTEYTFLALGLTSSLIFKKRRTLYLACLASLLAFLIYWIVDSMLPFVPDPSFDYSLIPHAIYSVTVGVVFIEILFYRELLQDSHKRIAKKYRIIQTVLKEKEAAQEHLHLVNEELNTTNQSLNDVLHQMDSTVRQKSRELQSYLEVINIHIYSAVTDKRGTILKVNDPLIKITGYSSEELIGNNFRMLNSGFHSKEFYDELFQSINNGRRWRGETRNKAKDGSIFWIDQVILPVFQEDESLSHFLMLALPITERKERENERFKTVQMLESIAFRSSHQVRGPLARVLGLSYLLDKGMIRNDEMVKVATQLVECSRELDSSTRELTAFVNRHHKFFTESDF